MTDDGTAKRGTVTLQSATGDGSGSGVASVTYRYRTSPAGTWTTACTSASSPFSCSWNTAALADGLYDLQAIATDGVALTTTSATVTGVRLDNTAPATTTMTNPGTPLSGSVTLSGTATDAGAGIASVRFQYAPTGTTTWADACTDTSTPYSCAWDTTTLADGVYDLRALSTDNAGNTRASTTIASRRVDNVAPTVSRRRPRQPAARHDHRRGQRRRRRRHRVGDDPAQADERQHLDDDLHGPHLAVLVQLEHHRR